jgi:hypothetical protein
MDPPLPAVRCRHRSYRVLGAQHRAHDVDLHQPGRLVRVPRAARPPEQAYPLGHWREAYVWSLFAALGLVRGRRRDVDHPRRRRTPTGAVHTNTPRLRSWGSRSAPARRGPETARVFASFQPAISTQALKKISGEVRRWRLHRWIGRSMGEIAREINPIVRGWMQYYGAFYRSALYPVLQRINAYLMRWMRDKYKRLRSMKKAMAAWQRVTGQYPGLFAHWAWSSQSWWSG